MTWINDSHGSPSAQNRDDLQTPDLWEQYREGEITWEEYLWEKEEKRYMDAGRAGESNRQTSNQYMRSRITPVDKRGEKHQNTIPNQTDHQHTLYQWDGGSNLDLLFGWNYTPGINHQNKSFCDSEFAGIMISNRSLHFSTPPPSTAREPVPTGAGSRWKVSLGNTGSTIWHWPRMIYDSDPKYLWSSPQPDWNGLMVQHQHFLANPSGVFFSGPNHSLQWTAGFWYDERQAETPSFQEISLSAGALELDLFHKRKLIAKTGLLFPFQNSTFHNVAQDHLALQTDQLQMVFQTKVSPWKTDVRISGNRSGSAALKYAKRSAESSVSLRGDWISPNFHHPWYPYWYSQADTVDALYKAPRDNWFSIYSRWRRNLGAHWSLAQVYRIRPQSQGEVQVGQYRHYLSQKLTGNWKLGVQDLPLEAELRARNPEFMEDPSALTLRLRSEIQFGQSTSGIMTTNHARYEAKTYALRAGIESAPGVWIRDAIPGAELSLRVSEGLNQFSQELEINRVDFGDQKWKWYSRLKWMSRWKSGWQGAMEWALSLSFTGARRESLRLRIAAEIQG